MHSDGIRSLPGPFAGGEVSLQPDSLRCERLLSHHFVIILALSAFQADVFSTIPPFSSRAQLCFAPSSLPADTDCLSSATTTSSSNPFYSFSFSSSSAHPPLFLLLFRLLVLQMRQYFRRISRTLASVASSCSASSMIQPQRTARHRPPAEKHLQPTGDLVATPLSLPNRCPILTLDKRLQESLSREVGRNLEGRAWAATSSLVVRRC
eukprot:1580605-Rhodomonas_salina.3